MSSTRDNFWSIQLEASTRQKSAITPVFPHRPLHVVQAILRWPTDFSRLQKLLPDNNTFVNVTLYLSTAAMPPTAIGRFCSTDAGKKDEFFKMDLSHLNLYFDEGDCPKFSLDVSTTNVAYVKVKVDVSGYYYVKRCARRDDGKNSGEKRKNRGCFW